jgi:hypothetical protein
MGTHERLSGIDRRAAASNRRFGVTIGAGLAAIGVALALSGHAHGWPWFAGAVAFILLAVYAAPLLGPLAAAWLRLALFLHRVTNPVILGLIWWGAIVPAGLIVRLAGNDLLRLKLDAAAASYWIARDPERATPLTKQY